MHLWHTKGDEAAAAAASSLHRASRGREATWARRESVLREKYYLHSSLHAHRSSSKGRQLGLPPNVAVLLPSPDRLALVLVLLACVSVRSHGRGSPDMLQSML